MFELWKQIHCFERTYFTMIDCGMTVNDLMGLVENRTPISEKFVRLFFKRYHNNWIIYNDESKTPNQSKVQDWQNKFAFAFDTTYERYSKMIELYESQKNNLLNKIQSSSQIKFNDTPQEDRATATDGYNSTITSHDTQTDPDELILRLKTISDNYEDTYRKWINSFDFLFGEVIDND